MGGRLSKVLDSSSTKRDNTPPQKESEVFYMNNEFVTEGNNAMAVDMGLVAELEKYKADVKIHPVNNRFDKHGNPYMGIIFHFDDMNGKRDRQAFQAVTVEELWKKRTKFLTELYYQKQARKEAVKQVAVVAPVVSVYQPTYPIQQVPNVVCKTTISQAVDSFMVYYKPTVSYQTYLGEVTNANFVKANMGDMKVSDITFNDFQSLVNARTKRNDGKQATEKTVRNLIIFFNRLMKYCRRQKWLTLDDLELITSDIKIPTYITDTNHEEEVKESKFLEYEETGEILRVLKKNPRYYLVARILFLTGMRPQEFFGLEKTDLFPEENYISIRQALVVNEKIDKNDRAFRIGTTKNKYSRRRIPANKEVFVYLDELEKLLVKNGSRAKAIKKGNGNMVIVDKNGNIVDEHSFGVNMGKHLKNNNHQGKKLTLNIPRHCYQDYLDDVGANGIDVDKSVGHVVDTTSEKFYKTKKYYVNRLLPYIEEMSKKIEDAYQNIRL